MVLQSSLFSLTDTMMSDAGTFAFIDGKLVQLSSPSMMAKMNGKNNEPLSKSEGTPLTILHNLVPDVPLATPVSTNPAIVSFTMTPSIPLGAVLSVPWVPGSSAVGVNLHGQPQVTNMAGLVQSNLSSPIQSNLTSNIQSNLTSNIHPNLTSNIKSNLTSNIQTAPIFHQNVIQPSIHNVLSAVPIIQPSMPSVMPTVPIIQPSIQEGIQQNVAVAQQGVSMVVQNFPPILTQMPSMINQGTINIVNQSPLPSNISQAVPSTQPQSVSVETVMSTQSSVRQTPSPAGPVISSVQSLSKPHISGKQFIYSPNNDCIGVMETFDPNPQLGPVGAKKPGNRWRTPTPPNMLSKTKTPPPVVLSKARTPVWIEPKVIINKKKSKHLDEKPSDLELMSSVQAQKPNSTPVPQTLFKRVMKTTGEPAVICINLKEKQMNLVELRQTENMSDKQITDFSQFNVRSTQETKTSLCRQELAQPKTSLSNQTVSHQPVAVASSHTVSDICIVDARTITTRQSKTISTSSSVVPQLDKFKQTGSSSQVFQQGSIPLNVFPNLGNQNKNLSISSQSAQKLNAIVVQPEDTETRLPDYWGGPNRVIHVTSANTSTSVPFSTVSQMGVDLANQYLFSPSSVVQLSSISKMGQDFINPSIQATEGNKSVLTSLVSESQYMLCTSSGTGVLTASKGGQIIVNPSSTLVNPSLTLVNQSSTLVSESSDGHRSLQGTQVGQILIKPVSAQQDFTISTGVAKKGTLNHSLSTGMAFGPDKIISSNGVSSIQSSPLASNPKTLENISVSRAGHQKGRTASESLFTNMYAKLQMDVDKSWKKDAKSRTLLMSPPVEIVNKKAPLVIPCDNFTSEAPFKASSLTHNKIPFTVSSTAPTQVTLKTSDVIDLTEETSSAEFLEMSTRVSASVESGNKGSIENDYSDKQKSVMFSTSSSNCGTKSATEIFVDLTAEEENLQEVEKGKNKFTVNSSQLLNKIAEKGAINIDSSTKQSQEKSGMPKCYIEVDLTGPSSPDQSAVVKEIQSNNQSETETSTDTQSEGISKPSFLVELNDGSGIFAQRVENLTKLSEESTYRLDSAGENSLKSNLDPSTSNPALNLALYYLPQPNVKKDMEVQNKAERSFNDCFLSFCSQQEPESDPVISENELPVQKHQVKMKEKITDSSSKESSKRRLQASDKTARSRKRLGKRSGEEKNSGPRSKRSNRKRLGRSNTYYKYSFCSDTSESEGNYSEYSDSDCMTEIYINVDTNNDKADIDSKDVLDSVKIMEPSQGIEAGNNLYSLPVQFCRVVLTRINDLETHNGLLDPDKLCSKKCREAHIKTLC